MKVGSIVVYSNPIWKVNKLAIWKTKIEDQGGSEIVGHIFWNEICLVLDFYKRRKVVLHDEDIIVGPEAYILTQSGFCGWVEAEALIDI